MQSFVGKFKDEFVARGAADEERRASEAENSRASRDARESRAAVLAQSE